LNTFHSFVSLVLNSIDEVTGVVEEDDSLLFLPSTSAVGLSDVALLNDVQVLASSEDLVSVTVQKRRNLKFIYFNNNLKKIYNNYRKSRFTESEALSELINLYF
jgi:hypothetical protein